MAYNTTEIVTIETPLGQRELKLELDVEWQSAEPDVGIMQDYIDNFTVTAVNETTRHNDWLNRICCKSYLSDYIVELIYDE